MLSETDRSTELYGKRKQKIHIEYDSVGYISVDELVKAEHR